MFEKLLKELDKIQKEGKVSVTINADDKGYLDKECPNEECLYRFKVYEEDWVNKVSDEEVFCPKCGHKANSDSWWTSEQLEEANQNAIRQITGRINKAMKDDARAFNRQQSRNSFIKMTMNVSGNSNTYILPIPALEELEQEITCSECETRYAVIGSGFFCPCCGHNSAEETFNNTVSTIEKTIENIEIVRTAVTAVSEDEAENTCRSLIEKGLLDCVVAFQRFCEVTYSKHPYAKSKIPFNAFQKLDVGEALWKEIINESYSDWLSSNELERINILFQRRHLLQHTEGIVDSKYIERSKDESYQVNQRIVTKEKDVMELVKYVKKLKEKIKKST
ncbi:hypothetical protein [Arenibacter algicola]|uniref:hypothetical protein n=1 Tax=Arenibacter algicola TaxID=616991 RepID=UPI0004DF9897|nr:hypothetical protein [Arenibacter algicola]